LNSFIRKIHPEQSGGSIPQPLPMIHAKAWLIPVFLFIAFLEFWISQREEKPYFSKANTAMNLTIGAIDQIVSLFGFYLLFLALEFMYGHFRLFTWEVNWQQWVLAYIAVDFVSYWYHRYCHQINILWAGHITHHSSSYFNFTNGFRTSPFQGLNRIPFWLVLPILGFSPFVLVFTLKISGLFDFLQHTQWVPKLGFIEKIFITPSLHRVHHGKNQLYLDKNFGSTFSVWDRLFGTYQKETEPVVFGLTNSGYEDHDPWHALFYQYQQIWSNLNTSASWKTKLGYLFLSPSFSAKQATGFLKANAGKPGSISNDRPNFIYALVQLVLGAIGIILLLAFQDFMPVWALVLFALSAITGMATAVHLFQGQSLLQDRQTEQFRLLATMALSGVIFWIYQPYILIGVLLAAVLSLYLLSNKKG